MASFWLASLLVETLRLPLPANLVALLLLLESETSAAMSSLAMVGAASLTAAVAPAYVTVVLRLFGYGS